MEVRFLSGAPIEVIMKQLRIVFLGTPAFALPSLKRLHQKHTILALVTRKPSKQNRGQQLVPSPIHSYGIEHQLPVLTPENNQQLASGLLSLQPDLLVVVAYGLIISQEVLAIPKLGCLNLHGSLLPRWRGAAPIERALLAAEPTGGVTIMYMTLGMDEGPILAQQEIQINYSQSLEATRAQFAEVGAELLEKTIEQLEIIPAEEQNHSLATYAAKLEKTDYEIDWQQPAAYIWRQILVYQGKTWFTHQQQRLLVHQARVTTASGTPGTVLSAPLTIACGRGALEITLVQKPGKTPQTTAALFSKREHKHAL